MRNNYIFTRDDKCISVYKRTKIRDKTSKNYGEYTDHLVGHYSNMQGVINKLVHLELLDSGTVNELLADYRSVLNSVKQLVEASHV